MDQFPDIKHEDWREKVAKELKLQELPLKTLKLDESIEIDPFFDREISGLQYSRKEKSWKICSEHDARDCTNDQLLLDLQGGVNVLWIKNAQAIVDPEQLFSGIHLDFIDLILDFSTEVSSGAVDSWNNIVHGHNNVRQCGSTSSNLSCSTINFYFINLEKSVTEQLISIFDTIVRRLDEAEGEAERVEMIRSLVISKRIGKHIIEEIACKRSMEILWDLVEKSFGESLPYPSFHASCNYESNETSLESRYIELSAKGMTAALSSYDSIEISPADKSQKPVFHRRISRNIQHLLQMESFVQKLGHSYEGSAQIENIAQTIAKKAWKSIGQT